MKLKAFNLANECFHDILKFSEQFISDYPLMHDSAVEGRTPTTIHL